ncbi:cache domain-containing protein [Motiliproteus sp. SC1-56]|uniref:sensor histidine kinase n=1 Tax=Motiliproteus sp. SC1-56 TaxID=2799565 RepID=UPI001A8FC529|nr:cache domain-containing protein [Motiliproteus sp. SC1-56]
MKLLRPLKLWTLLFVLVALSMSALYGILLATDAVRQEAREQFFTQYNQQQLLMARQAAQTLETFFLTLNRSLGLVTSLFEDHPVNSDRARLVRGSLQKLNASLADSAIIDLVVFDRQGTVVAIEPDDPYTLGRNYAWRGYYRWARDSGRPGQMYTSPFMRLAGGQNRGDKALIVAQGIYSAEGTFKGVAMFTVNFDELARKHILPVRLGEDGYAWVADIHSKTLLVDPHGAVAGRTFEAAFLPEWPKLYSLLTATGRGDSGTDWYRYEDPANPERTVRKLLGYHTVEIGDHLWFVGVATPERQVEAQLSAFLRRQETFSLTLVISILAGTTVICGLLLAWNRMLSQRVQTRTADLEQARAQLERTFDELLASKKMAAVGQMALGLTHEIRNPLSAIRMNIKMLRKRFAPQGRLQEHFAIIDHEILRLNRLLSDVMGFARPGPLHLEAQDLNAIVKRVRLLLAERFEQEGIILEVNLPDPLSAVCDGAQIEQVLLNLILNALDAMSETPGEKALRIHGSQEAGLVSIQVCDCGCGVSPEAREKIFDPFYTTKSAGGGLGLSNSQRIMLHHGGTLELVESTASQGACFKFSLPENGPGENRAAEPPKRIAL